MGENLATLGAEGVGEVEDRGDAALLGEMREFDRCLLYTSDAADERSSVDLGGRRIIKKKKRVQVEAG